MSNSKSSKEQDKLFEQSEAQRNPRLALPQDFTVTTASEGFLKKLPGHGQRGDLASEAGQLLKESETANASKISGKGAPLPTEVDDAGKPHTHFGGKKVKVR